jgi:hypothetical protein
METFCEISGVTTGSEGVDSLGCFEVQCIDPSNMAVSVDRRITRGDLFDARYGMVYCPITARDILPVMIEARRRAGHRTQPWGCGIRKRVGRDQTGNARSR